MLRVAIFLKNNNNNKIKSEKFFLFRLPNVSSFPQDSSRSSWDLYSSPNEIFTASEISLASPLHHGYLIFKELSSITS